MVRFYNKFFRHQYPGALMVLVVMAVWLRFFAITAWFMVRKPFRLRHSRRGATLYPGQQAQAGPDQKQVVTSA
jgi:hypothetical protein